MQALRLTIFFSFIFVFGCSTTTDRELYRNPLTTGTTVHCNQLLLNVIESPKTSASKKFVKRYKKLMKSDGRRAWQYIMKNSPHLNLVDNFSSPATQQFIFSRKLSNEIKSTMITFKDTSASVDYLKEVINLPEETLSIVKSIEERFRVQAEVINATAILKEGSPALSKDVYALELQSTLVKSLVELQENIKFMDDTILFVRLLTIIESQNFRDRIVNQSHDILNLRFRATDLMTSFIHSFPRNKSFQEIVKDTSFYLESSLRELPVGMSYRVAELTASIRFGNRHFYGSWFGYDSTPRAAYERKARKLGGLMEAELNISNEKKKRMALTLDRSHQNLDHIYGLEKVCSRGFNTCGSYAPVFFIMHKVPILSYGYLTPTHPILSLAIQRALKLPLVKEVRFSHRSKTGGLIGVPIILFHDSLPFLAIELPIYTLYVSSVVDGIVYLINEETGDEHKIEVDKEGYVQSFQLSPSSIEIK